MKLIKNFFENKWVKWGVIPLILFLFWMCLSIIYYQNNFGITSLTSSYSSNNFIKYNTDRLQKGNKVIGEFKAHYNYLGIVAVRFNTYYQINDDIVRFRIREKGSRSWYYQNDYTTPQFQPNQLFTFGFPVLPNSQGKTYIFEIESLKGGKNNAVAISDIEPAFVTKYQYPSAEITSSPKKATEFIFYKIINSLLSIDFIISTFAYVLPLSMYIIYQLFFARYLADKFYLVLFPIMTILFIESLLINNTNDLLVLILTCMVAVTAYAYKLESSIVYTYSLFFLVLTGIFYTAGQVRIAENFTVWAYMLLIIGTIQALVEIKIKPNNLISLTEFAERIHLIKSNNYKLNSLKVNKTLRKLKNGKKEKKV